MNRVPYGYEMSGSGANPVVQARVELADAEVRRQALMVGFRLASGRHVTAAWNLIGRELAALSAELRPYVMAVDVAVQACAEADAALNRARGALRQTFTCPASESEWWSNRLTALRHVRYRAVVASTMSTELVAARERLNRVTAARRVVTHDQVDRVMALARELDLDELNVARKELARLQDALFRIQARGRRLPVQ